MPRLVRRLLAPLLVALACAAPARAAERVLETLSYHWRVTGLLRGLVLFAIPADGKATLTHRDLGNGHESVELFLFSDGADDGEFFRYGSEVEVSTGVALRGWSSYRWRGETKSRESRIDQARVVDIASAILALRRDPPRLARPMEIWSDGKLYPVVVVPQEVGHRHRGGSEVKVRRFEIRGVQLPGRRVWKGGIDLWLAEDPASTPLEIRVERSLASVVLTLDP